MTDDLAGGLAMRLTVFIALLLLAPAAAAQERTQVFFKEPAGMKVYWLTLKDGKPAFSKTPLETPGRFNFRQGAGYRLKLTHLPGHAGLELYPTLEVVQCNARAREFLAHNSVPIELTDDEIKQVVKNNFLVKVVYLPSNGDDGIALAVGQDAVSEAARRGSVLLVLRIGNISAP
jgi:hypothetical protein